MLFLIDSNIAITSDPLSHVLEASAESAMQFMQLTATHHHDVRTHPASLMDFERDQDHERRRARLVVFERYMKLVSPPPISAAQVDELGAPEPGSNDEVDQLLLAAVIGNATKYLVTEDVGLHGRARRMGVEARVLTLSDAIAMLRALHADLPDPPPSVRVVKAHVLDINDAIFDGLKEDYGHESFVVWFEEKCAQTGRDALLVDGDGEHAAVVILKPEPTGEFGLSGRHLKVCTFKVGAGYNGQKYGELLLKAVFDRASVERYDGLFVTVLEKQEALIALLQDFGFRPLPGVRTRVGELVFAKPLAPSEGDDSESLNALDFHVRYGPPALRVTGQQCHAIPIEPRWHRVLFPDAEREPEDEDALFSATEGLTTQPFGNALRKAYLCRASSRLLQPGNPLLFYRSQGERAVSVIGVCEATISSSDPLAIVAAVGRRTVYSLPEIEAMTRGKEVLVIMFRQAIVLRYEPITLSELVAGGVLASHPQAVQQTRSGGTPWLAQRLGV